MKNNRQPELGIEYDLDFLNSRNLSEMLQALKQICREIKRNNL